MITRSDRVHLQRAVELAEQALLEGDAPFGSVLVSADGTVLFEDHNHETRDGTAHPEFAIARWAALNLDGAQRAAATVYTSGEHCPMCSAAHAWVGLGRIVYATSAAQLTDWREQAGAGPAPVRPLPIQEIAPGIAVDGPDGELSERVRELQRRHRER